MGISVINIFIKIAIAHFVSSVIGIVSFTALIVLDTQKIKSSIIETRTMVIIMQH